MSKITQQKSIAAGALSALLMAGLFLHPGDLSGSMAAQVLRITKCDVRPNGTVTLEWQGAVQDVVVEYSTNVVLSNWIPVPATGNHWPINGTNWTGLVPLNAAPIAGCFFRVRTTGGQASPPMALQTISFDLIGIHDPGSRNYNANCIGCHGDRTKEVALDGRTPAAHSIMLELFDEGIRPAQRVFGNERCLECHRGGPDFLTQSAGGLRKQVDYKKARCIECHQAPVRPVLYMR